MKRNKAEFEQIDALINQGQIVKAKVLLRPILNVQRSKWTEHDIIQIAQFCRRVSWFMPALKLLRSFVRPDDKRSLVLHSNSTIEYAAALTFVGADAEAISLLNKIDRQKHPQADLFTAFALFSIWNYEESFQYLERYVSSSKITEHQKLIGNVNLLSALVNSNRNEKALDLGEKLIELAPTNLLRINILEILTQATVQLGQIKAAKRYLKEIEKYDYSTQSTYSALINLQRIRLVYLQGEEKQQIAKNLGSIREFCIRAHRWEIYRESFLVEAIGSCDRELGLKLYFGTPYLSFKKRVQSIFNFTDFEIDGFKWKSGLDSDKKSLEIDLSNPNKIEIGKFSVKGDSLPSRFLMDLTSEFFRPRRIGAIASTIFPGEEFHPIHSTAKVHQLAIRLRKKIDINRIPIKIISRKSEYSILWSSSYTLIPKKNAHAMSSGLDLNFLKKGQEYRLVELENLLNVPRRSLQRKLKDAINDGFIKAIGQTKSKRYLKN